MKKTISILLACLLVVVSASLCVSAAGDFQAFDVNMDGRVDISDVTTIQCHLAEFDKPTKRSICLDNISSYVPKELEFIPILISEEVTEGDGYIIIDSSMLTDEILAHRTEQDVLIVERIIGVVTNDEGDGRVLNTNGSFRYINYRYIYEPTKTGTVVLTYYIYNPNNNRINDKANRYDFVIDRSFE